MRIPTWTVVAAAAAAAAALALGVGFTVMDGGWTKDGILSGTRITARWAFPWFLAAWTASSIAKLWPGGWRAALLRRRRAVGLAFAANHFVHLGFLLIALNVFGEFRALPVLIGGGTTYAFIAAMALTSNDAAVRWMGRGRWKLLHQAGGWAVFGVFANSYIGRLMEKPGLAVPAVSLLALALALRIAAALKGRLSPQAA